MNVLNIDNLPIQNIFQTDLFDKALTGTTTPSQSGTGSNDNEEILPIHQSRGQISWGGIHERQAFRIWYTSNQWRL